MVQELLQEHSFNNCLLSSEDVLVAKSLQLCPTLCYPIDGSPPGSPVPGILQARTLEWLAVSFSNAWKWKVKVKSLSRVQLLATRGLQPTRLLCPWDSPGNNTGLNCHFLLQGIFLNQVSSPGLLHCRQILYHLSHQGSLWTKFNLSASISPSAKWR